LSTLGDGKSVPDMTGCLARYAEDNPVKPLSEIRELVWREVAKGRVARDSRRENDMSELSFQY